MAARISDAESGASLSGADVRLNVQPVSDPINGPPGMETPLQELRTDERPENGLYRVAHSFERPGKYDVTIMVHQAREQTASATAFTTSIDVTTPAPSDGPERSNGFTRLAMVGGVAMALALSHLTRFSRRPHRICPNRVSLRHPLVGVHLHLSSGPVRYSFTIQKPLSTAGSRLR